MNLPSLYIGLMSGTSMDGVDGVLAEFTSHPAALRVVAHAHVAFPEALHDELQALNRSGPDELHRAALAGNALVAIQTDVVQQLLRLSGTPANLVAAIGSHGQTVRHRPGEFDKVGYTLQVNQGALLAERCGIDVVCDFRSRDVAAGGQGAPLVPAFHAMVFGGSSSPRAVLNLGGIANLTLLPGGEGGSVRGFDCGPGNALLDHWISLHLGLPFDARGHWASTGNVDQNLLNSLLAEPFLQAAPPKSTGRDLFNAQWLARRLSRMSPLPDPQDVMATLAQFTARCVADALRAQGADCRELLVCGGGALNTDLMRRLENSLPGVKVSATDNAGLPVMQVEAAAFAWLARAFLMREAGNRPEVTGARGLRVLGAHYPAG